jgi:SAM-dependent methyltransferase
MKESDIRNRDAHARYLELVQRDAAVLANDASQFEAIPCPVCGVSREGASFVKSGFRYVTCTECDTLYVSPRPTYEALERIYRDSKSTKYWVEEFFKPVAEVRREKIFRPRAQFVAERFADRRAGRIGDIGAGFGLFLDELRSIWPDADLVAIEPSSDMAALCRERGLDVLETMLEDIGEESGNFDVLTAFELFEHLHDPLAFLKRVRTLLKPGALLVFTTLSGLGFDIRVLWEESRSVSPPHHLNFANPFSIGRLLKRAGFEAVEVTTPGVLDWDIVEGALQDGFAGDRLCASIAKYGSEGTKGDLQAWIQENRFSSHMRVVAKAV